MKVLVILLLLLLFCLIWVYIRYDPKLDRIKNKDNSYVILWYNKYCWNGEVKRTYIKLFDV